MSATSGMDNGAVIRGVELRLDTLIAGIESGLPAHVTELKVGNVTYKISDLIAKAQELNRSNKAKRAAHSVLRQARLTNKRDHEASLEFLADAKAALVALLGRKSAELVDFGFKPEEPRGKRARSEKKPDTNQGIERNGV
jgi:hypothetical protein